MRTNSGLAREEEGKGSTISPTDANADDVTITLRFESVVAVDEDTSIWVDLHDDFGGFSLSNVTVMQNDADGDAQEVSMATNATGKNAFYISEDEDGDNVGMGDVTVTITDLTNPDMVGTLNRAIIVRQGEFAAVAADFSLQGAEISTDSPGADVRVEISTWAGATIPGGDDITVTLEDFGIPDTIDESDVIIQTDRNTNPSDVSVDGDDITLSLPTTIGDTIAQYNVDGAYSIVFKQGAGLTNPTSGGAKDITVSDMDADDHEMSVNIEQSVSVDPSFVVRGDEATVTAKGLGDGTATVHHGSKDGMVLGSGTADDGVVEIVIDTSDLELGASKDGDSDKGANYLYVKDADNEVVGTTSIGIKPKISLGSDSVKRFRYAGNHRLRLVLRLQCHGNHRRRECWTPQHRRQQGHHRGNSSGDRALRQPGSEGHRYRQPQHQVGDYRGKRQRAGPDHCPSTVVPGSQITITGSSFVKNTDLRSIMIEDEAAELPDPDDRESTSAGRIAYTTTVPLGVGDGELDVVVTVGTGANERVGVGTITVPEPEITLDPTESVPGSVISVRGSGFASSGRVEVKYDGAIEEVGRADSSGEFHIRLEIPSDAGVGTTNEVRVEVRNQTSINDTAEHKTPGPAITLPETALVGDLMTVSGTNFEPFTSLDIIVGGKDATPTNAETDRNGAFELEVRVPRLSAGSHTVTVRDGSVDANSQTETFDALTVAIIRTPEEVFGVLGNALTVVWHYNNDDQSWASYSPVRSGRAERPDWRLPRRHRLAESQRSRGIPGSRPQRRLEPHLLGVRFPQRC